MDTPNNTEINNIEECRTILDFWKIETVLILIAVICLIITIGCIILLIIDGGKNCSLSNACFGMLGSIIGLLGGLFANYNKCGRKDSIT